MESKEQEPSLLTEQEVSDFYKEWIRLFKAHGIFVHNRFTEKDSCLLQPPAVRSEEGIRYVANAMTDDFTCNHPEGQKPSAIPEGIPVNISAKAGMPERLRINGLLNGTGLTDARNPDQMAKQIDRNVYEEYKKILSLITPVAGQERKLKVEFMPDIPNDKT